MSLTSNPAALNAALAAHRFGLGEASFDAIGGDARGWLAAQIGPADAARGDGLLTTPQALEHVAAERAQRQLAKNPPAGMTAAQVIGAHYRDVIVADMRSRLLTAATTTRPFAERLQWFWSNHFTVSLAKGSARGLVGAFERDAIRPHIAGSFEALLTASTTHPAMLRYLDNVQSAGPNSRIVARVASRAERDGQRPRVTGLNENLAREVLELHTLGAESARGPNGSYGQADVTAFARVLTGWRVGLQPPDAGRDPGRNFDAAWHEPGAKTVLGKTYPEGPQALPMVLHDLAVHPATARFVATKLARHFVADEPPSALVDRLAAVYLKNDTQLAPVYRALIASDDAWRPRQAKLKTPEEFVISATRVLRTASPGGRGDVSGTRNASAIGFAGAASAADADDRAPGQATAGARAGSPVNAPNLAAAIGSLGQRLQAAPSPAGWSDRAADWLGPDAVWKRIEWSTGAAARFGDSLDSRAIAAASLGPLLSDTTRTQLDRAADGQQALALLLMAPEFQRR